jgi:EmrB/QacA subfamily drug resistance transporter
VIRRRIDADALADMTRHTAAAGRDSCRAVLAVLCLAQFAAMLDNVIVTNALPRIGVSFDAGVSELQWIAAGYSLTYAALLLTGGALGDRCGPRRTMLVGLAVFTGGSAACALSDSSAALIACRAVQGAGAALVSPASLPIVRLVCRDPVGRGRALGLLAAVTGLGLVAGPLISGPLIEAYGWRAVFWVNVPIGVAALSLGARVLPSVPGRRGIGVDVAGHSLSVIGLACAVFSLVEGPVRGWDAPLEVATALVAVSALAGFLVVEARGSRPMLDPRLLTDRVVAGAMTGAFTVSFAVFGVLFSLTLQMQDVYGWSPLGAALAMLPAPLVVLILAPLSGRVAAARGPRLPLCAGVTLCAAALAGLSMYGVGAHYPAYFWVIPVLGAGMGLTFTPVSVAIATRAPDDKAATITAAAAAVQEFGGTLGVAALGAVLSIGMRSDLREQFNALGTPAAVRGTLIAATTGAGPGGFDSTARLTPALRAAVDESFVAGVHEALRCGALLLLAASGVIVRLMRVERSRGR